MAFFIDSNIFLRTLIKEDEKSFEECYLFLNLIRQNKIKGITSSLILAEVDWILESFYKFEKSKVLKALNSILNLKGLKITDKMNPKLVLEMFRDKNVKFIDALIASNPAIFQKKVVVVSYDKDFDKIGVIRKTPGQIVK